MDRKVLPPLREAQRSQDDESNLMAQGSQDDENDLMAMVKDLFSG